MSTIRITRKEIISLFAGEVRSSITMSPALHCHLQFYYEWIEDLNAETKFFFFIRSSVKGITRCYDNLTFIFKLI